MKNIDLGRAIRKRRLERSLKVFQLANNIHVDPVYITQIEKHGKVPSPTVMERISTELSDRDLLTTYLKIKFPLIYEEIEKFYLNLSPEMEAIFKELRRENRTPGEQKKLEKRIVKCYDNFMKDKGELKKALKIFDVIEAIALSIKKREFLEGVEHSKNPKKALLKFLNDPS